MRRALLRLGAAALAFAPLAANADPLDMFFIIEVAWGATAAGVVASMMGVAGALTLASVAASVYGSMDARRRARHAQEDAIRAYNAGLQDRTITALRAEPPWRVVYGQCRIGGDVVAIFTSDKQDTRTNGSAYTKADGLKHLVIVLAAHEVEDIVEMYLDGVAVGPVDANGWATTGDIARERTYVIEQVINAGASYTFPAAVEVLYTIDKNGYLSDNKQSDTGWSGAPVTYTVTGGGKTVNCTGTVSGVFVVRYTASIGDVRWSKHLGSASQAADAYLAATLPDQWGEADRLAGLAYVSVTLDLENQRFQGGPPQLSWLVKGRKLYDPRKDSTVAGGAGSHRANNPATWQWSDNPALAVRDYLCAAWGFECAPGDIDDAFTMRAADACDVPISLTVGSTTTPGQSTYTCNGAVLSDDDRGHTLDALAQSMAGYAVYGARWQIMAGAWSAPVLSLGDEDLDGQIEIVQAGAALDDIFNGMRGSYAPAGSGTPSDFSYANPVFVAGDGRELWTDVALPFTDDAARARNLARVFTEAARDSQVIRLPAKLRAWPLQVGDRVSVTSAEYGLAAKLYRVTDWQFGLATPVTLTLQEDAAAIYDQADAASADPAPNTGLPSPWTVPAVAGVSAGSGDPHVVIMGDGSVNVRTLVTWLAYSGPYVADGSGRIEVRWRSSLPRMVGGAVQPGAPADHWEVAAVPGSATSAYIDNCKAGELLTIAVVAVNGIGQQSAASVIVHTVIGKTAAASAVAGFAAAVARGVITWSWARPLDADYGWTEVRAVDAGWGSIGALFRGRVTAWIEAGADAGTYTRYARHCNDAGVPSASSAAASAVVTAADVATWSDIAGRPTSFRVLTRGGSCSSGYPSGTAGLTNAETGAVLGGVARSWLFVRLRRSDGAVTYSQSYDVYGQGAIAPYKTAADLAVDLNATGSDSIAVVYTWDEPQLHRLDSGMAAAMYRCGASKAVFGSPQFAIRSAYVLIGIGGCGEGNGFEAYQGSSDNDPNAWVDVSFQLQNGNLVVTGMGATPRTLADYAYVGDLNATASLSLLNGANCTITGSTVTKTSGANAAWDAWAWARDGFAGGAMISFVPAQTNCYIMVGLAHSPTGASWSEIDYGMYLNGIGELYYEEAGAYASLGPYEAGDVLAVTYDGSTVRYWRNGVAYARTVSVARADTLYPTVYAYTTGAQVTRLQAGPMSSNAWAAIGGTGKPADHATKNVVSYSTAAPSSPSDGDLWCDTSVIPVVWKVRIGGVWLLAANLSTGALAQLDRVDTAQIVDWAATAAYVDVATTPIVNPIGGNACSRTLAPGLYEVTLSVRVRCTSFVDVTYAQAYLYTAGFMGSIYGGTALSFLTFLQAGQEYAVVLRFTMEVTASSTIRFRLANGAGSSTLSYEDATIFTTLIKK